MKKTREERLEAALRENLKRRKDAERAQGNTDKTTDESLEEKAKRD